MRLEVDFFSARRPIVDCFCKISTFFISAPCQLKQVFEVFIPTGLRAFSNQPFVPRMAIFRHITTEPELHFDLQMSLSTAMPQCTRLERSGKHLNSHLLVALYHEAVAIRPMLTMLHSRRSNNSLPCASVHLSSSFSIALRISHL